MQKETISRKTFVKSVTAVAVTAASLGILNYTKYPDTENYTSSASGMESDVSVTLVMDGDVIKDVQVDVSGETQGIGAAIGDEIRQQILKTTEGQGTPVEVLWLIRLMIADCIFYIVVCSPGAALFICKKELSPPGRNDRQRFPRGIPAAFQNPFLQI